MELLLNGKSIGSVSVSDGLFASCPADFRYVYRLFGNSYIGVMVPDGDRFVLKKHGVFTETKFEILRSLPGEAPAFPLPFALSQGENAENAFEFDSLLSECLSYQKDVLSAVFRNERYVYFPFSPENICLAPFFFCLTVFTAGGKEYAAFKIKDGTIMPV